MTKTICGARKKQRVGLPKFCGGFCKEKDEQQARFLREKRLKFRIKTKKACISAGVKNGVEDGI